MRFRLQVEYDGSAYSGWQVQNGQVTIQGEIEKALTTIFGIKLELLVRGELIVVYMLAARSPILILKVILKHPENPAFSERDLE